MKPDFDACSDRSEILTALCQLMHDVRKRLNLKAADVARLANFSEPTYYGMESGKTHSSLDNFIRAFKAMKIYPSLALLAAESVVDSKLPLKIDVDFLILNRMP